MLLPHSSLSTTRTPPRKLFRPIATHNIHKSKGKMESRHLLDILSSAEDIISSSNHENFAGDEDLFSANEDSLPFSDDIMAGIISNQSTFMGDSSSMPCVLEPTPIGPNASVSHLGCFQKFKGDFGSLPTNQNANMMNMMGLMNPFAQAAFPSQATSSTFVPSCNNDAYSFGMESPSKRQRTAAWSEQQQQQPDQALSSNIEIASAPLSQAKKSSPKNSDVSSLKEISRRGHFRQYQADQWRERFAELEEFKKEQGHSLVPHSYPPNQQLAQWTKRQRYQYKLKNMGRHSTLTDARQRELEAMGFIWDSHKAAWYERYESLKEFYFKHGHANVPSNYEHDKSLAIWVKCQRRQMKLYQATVSDPSKKSTMTLDRIQALDALDFDWNPRNL